MTDSDVQKMIDDFAQHGDAYTSDQWKKFQRDLDRYELEKCSDYWKWKAGDDDAD